VAGSCELSNEPSGSIKVGEFDSLMTVQFSILKFTLHKVHSRYVKLPGSIPNAATNIENND
jgi:hypothetical protein